MFIENELFQQVIPWNTLFRQLAIGTGILFLLLRFRREKIPVRWWQVLALIAFAWLSGVAGARLFSLFDRATALDIPIEWPLFFRPPAEGMLRWYGSLLTALLLLPLFMRLIERPYRWRVFDLCCLTLCLVIVVLKQGCQFAGDGCYGVPTTLPWGMYYSGGLKPSLLPVHPTPIYDSLFHLGLFAYLWKWRRQASFEGQTGLLFFMASATFCFLLDFIRANPVVAGGMTMAQWTYLGALVVAGVFYWQRQRAGQGLGNLRAGQRVAEVS